MKTRIRLTAALLTMASAIILAGATAVRADTNNCPAPSVRTTAATGVTGFGATLNGRINPNDSAVNGCTTYYYFQYGTTTRYGSVTTMHTLGAGQETVSVSAKLTNTSPGKTYHYRLVAININTVSRISALGGDQSFRARVPTTVSLDVAPHHRGRTPYAFLATGRVRPASSRISKKAACYGTVHLTITQSGRSKTYVSSNASLKSDCTFSKTLVMSNKTKKGIYSVGAHFNSNSVLTGNSAKHVKITVG